MAPSFLLACVLWHDVRDRWSSACARRRARRSRRCRQAIDAVFDARIGDISGRGKLAADMREIWMMQPRFERRTGNAPFTLVEQPRFRAGFDFLRLRADAGEVDVELADWWQDFALGDDEEREALLDGARASAVEARARRRRRLQPPRGDARAAAKKRRRRRRKPAGAPPPSG